jgi:hypothetical protein
MVLPCGLRRCFISSSPASVSRRSRFDVFINARFDALQIFVHPRFETLETSRNPVCEFVVRGVLLFLGHFSHRKVVAKSVKSVSPEVAGE